MYPFIALEDAIAARGLLQQIDKKIIQTARSGSRGVNREWLMPGLRAIPFKNHGIYFTIIDDELHVIRILHGRQNMILANFTESSD
ncbi:type II toxin-antitoxin system RelE/ParE family toxin [Rhizobium sp. P32RR-XVIII]|uniref:type II toxin-antitoxin system RelE/ParE family toxin n=1 Tax=Rhizobium sp. P32RR-XVIII TaxID=2726738 RepID=UPI0028B0FD9B|nr:type II toxin-antitoxin system RelE/ParE family toxin [Rhizobium sp. P32RR-XVIII]